MGSLERPQSLSASPLGTWAPAMNGNHIALCASRQHHPCCRAMALRLTPGASPEMRNTPLTSQSGSAWSQKPRARGHLEHHSPRWAALTLDPSGLHLSLAGPTGMSVPSPSHPNSQIPTAPHPPMLTSQRPRTPLSSSLPARGTGGRGHSGHCPSSGPGTQGRSRVQGTQGAPRRWPCWAVGAPGALATFAICPHRSGPGRCLGAPISSSLLGPNY